MREHIPDVGTPEHFDYLLDGLEGEVRLSERYDVENSGIQFYKDRLRAEYQGRGVSDIGPEDRAYVELCLFAALKTYERTGAKQDKLMVIAYLGRLIDMVEVPDGRAS